VYINKKLIIVNVLQTTIDSHKFRRSSTLFVFVATGSQASKQRKQR